MNILFLTRLYWPHVGGVEKHIREISLRLIKDGHEITVITTKHKKNLKDEEKSKGIKIVRFKQPKIKYLGLLYTWVWFIKNISLIRDSDIIHIHDVFIWYWPFKLLFPKKSVYTTFHGRWGEYPLKFVDILQKQIGARFSNKVLSIGEYIPRNYGFKSDYLSYGAVEVPKEQERKDNDLIVYVGRLDEDIALQKYFEVFKRISKKRVEFCGDGELRKECERYGKVHGFTDPTPFYNKARFCFASGYLTILEAMAHKCIVVTAYDSPLKRDYYKLAPFNKWIISSDSPKKIAKLIENYSKDKTKTQKILNEGYNWVKLQSWEKLSKQYLTLWGIETV